MPEIVTRRLPADARPASWDDQARTFEAVISTGAPVRRRDTRGAYTEVLDLSAVDLADLAGLPVLDSHQRASARDTIGIVRSARREGGAIIASIRLGLADDIAPIAARARDGLLSVSIGYREAARREATVGGERTVTVTPDIFEASLVAVPADRQAKIRSSNMPDLPEIDTPPLAPEAMPEADQARIRSLGELADLPPSFAEAQIAAGATIEEARTAARAAMVERTRSAPRIRVQSPASEDPAVRLRAMEDALHVRTAGGTPSDAARPFMRHTLRDLAREALALRGISTRGMADDDLFRAAHTTSDFPNLLTAVGSRMLMPAYTAAQSPLRTVLARQGSRNDFRQGSTLRLGEVGALPKVSENGEITHTSRAEAANGYALDTFASIFSISRKALLNDDLGAFRDWASAAGQAAAQTEAGLLWSLLSQSGGAGPVMDDGVRLFHATHGNLAASGTNLSDTAGLAAARLALRTMKGLDGKTPIAVTPKYLMVGPARETAAEKLLASLNAATVTDVNPFAGRLTLLVEPRITTNAWYVFADPAQVPVLEYSYLSSAPGPQMSSREGFDVLGTEFRVVLDFGAGAVDWRGAYRDAGA
jgi:hypothetical protein